MKQPIHRKLNAHFYSAVSVLIIFGIVALLYHNFSRNLDSVFAEPELLPAVRSEAVRFVYGILVIFTLALTLFFVVFLFYRFHMNCLRQDFRQTSERFRIAFENLGESIWEYNICRYLLKK